ncbi:YdgA family protein [Biostraticola tofi]|uniref:Uncharacterized protein YdgA (DUF945 family) n=1 Tax=Biostraticola tofi TaxID=466109 RepID=A0A4R3Z1Y7_9GAMM|nr:YdgA family protein [Biostraticola tofi]TCV99781.1 uncharacterized protein YdgA (DUF945 family) [Biostraticola tofi]
MKKTLVAVSVIVILGAAWTGAAWYTGKQFEQRLPGLVASANDRLNTAFPEAGVKLAYQDYQRGLFNSHLNLVLQSDGSTGENKPLKPGEEIVLREAVSHGPLPFAQLKRGVLIPSMASVHSELVNTPASKAAFDAAKGQSPLTAETRVSYNGDTASAIDLAELDYKGAETRVRSSGGSFDTDVSRDGKTVKIDGGISSLLIGYQKPGQNHEQLTLQEFKLENDTKASPQGYSIGNNTLKAKSLAYNLDGKDILVIDNPSQVTKADETDGKMGVNIVYSLDKLSVQGEDFGSGKAVVNLSNLDPKALEQFSTHYHDQVEQIMQHTGDIEPAALQSQITQAFLQNLPTALKGSPYLSIAPLSWKNSKGESAFNLTLNMNDPAQSTEQPQTPEQAFSRYINKIEAKLTVPLDMATYTTAQVGKLQGYSAEDADKLAKQQVQGLAAMGQMFKLTTVKDDVLTSSFYFADGQINLNGQKMSLQDFLGMFGMFGLGQPAQPGVALPAE